MCRCEEDWFANVLLDLNKHKQEHFSPEKRDFLQRRLIREMAEFFSAPRSVKDGKLSLLTILCCIK